MAPAPTHSGERVPLSLPRRLVLLGNPVAHSLSPVFQNAALDAAGLALRYEPVDVPADSLAGVLAQLRHVRAGGNVTVPHKTAVAGACDTLTDLARVLGAVNTFWCADDGSLVGDNTDVVGAEAALRALAGRRNARNSPRVALIGAGGAASALVEAVRRLWPGARVAVWSRRRDASDALAARFADVCAPAATLGAALGDAGVVVNATPLGLHDGDPLPCPVASLPPGAAVLDLVYAARETAWVRAARADGHPASDGLLMLVEQGAAAFERWFGRAPDRARMWQAVEAQTGRSRGAEERA